MMEKKSKEEIMREMDAAADEAAVELTGLDQTAVKLVASWMKRWYMKAGYKRLGRILTRYAKD